MGVQHSLLIGCGKLPSMKVSVEVPVILVKKVSWDKWQERDPDPAATKIPRGALIVEVNPEQWTVFPLASILSGDFDLSDLQLERLVNVYLVTGHGRYGRPECQEVDLTGSGRSRVGDLLLAPLQPEDLEIKIAVPAGESTDF